MNALNLLTGSAAQAIGWALLHLLWQATIVAGILAAVLALIPRRSATTRYAVACSALAIVFVLFVGTAIRAYDPAAAPIATTSESVAAESEAIPLSKIPVVIVATATEGWRDRAMDLVTSARQSLPSVVAIWFLGVVLLTSRLLVSFVQVRNLATRGVREASAEWQRVSERLCNALGLDRAVRLLESTAVEVPSVLGSLRPIILLPASTLTGMTPQQIEMVLAHELAHIRRHDFAVNLLQAFVETLMFYHPAVWWMSSRVRIERENCCDDLAVAVCGNPIQYARALTRLEELRAGVTPMMVAANGGSLLDRIRRIAGGRPEATAVSSRWAAAVAMLVIIAIVVAVPSVPALAQREDKQSSAELIAAAKAAEDRAEAEGTDDSDYEHDAGIDAEVDAVMDVDVEADASVDADIDTDLIVPSVYATAVVPPLAPHPAAPPSPAVYPAPMVAPTPAVAPIARLAELDRMNFEDDEEDTDDDNDRDSRDRKLSTGGKLTVDELISLRAVGVTPEYITQMRALFPELTVREVSGMRALGVTPDFIKEMRAAGMQIDSAKEAQGLAAVGVTGAYIRQMRDAGFTVSTARDATSLRAVGVTPEFVREMRDAGFEIKTAKDASSLRAVGVTPEYVRDMRAAGFEIKTAKDATSLRAVGVTPEYVRDMRTAGFEIKTAKDASGLRAVGVTPEYIRDMRAAGVEIKTAKEASGLRAVGVTPEFVRKLAAAGYSNLSTRELTRLAASGIDDDFIREMQQYRDKNK